MITTRILKAMTVILISTTIFPGCARANQNQPQNQNQVQPQSGTNVAQQSGPVYFTANEGGSVSKIDATTNKILDTIKIDGAAHNVQVSPGGTIIGVTVVPGMQGMGESSSMSKMGGTVQFYDAKTDKLIKTVNVGNHPAHVVFTQDSNFILVTNNQDDNVSVISARDYKALGTVPTGKGPHGFRISNDGKFAYVANMDEDTVSVIDIPNMKELRKIKVGKTPVTTGISSDGKTLVVTINAENALAVVNLATDAVEKIPVGVGPAQVFLENDNKYAFVANQGTEEKPSNTLSKIDMSTKKVVNTITVGKGAHGVVTSNDNKYVYVTNMYENTVSVVDNNTNTVAATVQVDKEPNGITYVK